MNYKVYLDGRELTIYPCRTSAIPFNRVWTGVQRPLDQTEISYFVSFDMTAPVDLEIEVLDASLRTFELRPREYAIPCNSDGNRIRIHLDEPRKFTVEVNGYHEALHVFANVPYDSKPSPEDENVLYFGAGEHDAGLIVPKSGQTVFIDEGAVVYGAIYVKDASHVTVMGHGILDSSRVPRGNELSETDDMYRALTDLGFSGRDINYYSQFTSYACDHLTLDGVIFIDSPLWAVTTRNHCTDVTINNIKIVGQWRYNADGIDLCNTDNASVSDCFIRAFDDCIVVRGPYLEGEQGGCQNITVRDNVLWCDWGKALEVWSGDHDSLIRDVLFENIHIIRPCHTSVSIDTWYGSESIVVENIRYEDITIDTAGPQLCPSLQKSDDDVFTDSGDFHSVGVRITVDRIGRNAGNQKCVDDIDASDFRICYRGIHFKNIKVSGTAIENRIGSERLSELSDVTFENCSFDG